MKIINTSGKNGPATDFTSIYPVILTDPSGNYFDLADQLVARSGSTMTGSLLTTPSGANSLGSASSPWSGIYVNQLNGNTIPAGGYVASGTALLLSGGVMSGNIATSVSGTNLIGASGTPWSGIWVNSINGLPITTTSFSELPTGDVDGFNDLFRFSGIPIGNVDLFKNGLLMAPNIDYTKINSSVLFTLAPAINERIYGTYQYNTLAAPAVPTTLYTQDWQSYSDGQSLVTNPPNWKITSNRGAGTYTDVYTYPTWGSKVGRLYHPSNWLMISYSGGSAWTNTDWTGRFYAGRAIIVIRASTALGDIFCSTGYALDVFNGASWSFYRIAGGQPSTSLATGAWAGSMTDFTCRLVAKGSLLKGYLNGNLLFAVTDSTYSVGTIAYGTPPGTIYCDNIVVTDGIPS